jgi:hypothetical protein
MTIRVRYGFWTASMHRFYTGTTGGLPPQGDFSPLRLSVTSFQKFRIPPIPKSVNHLPAIPTFAKPPSPRPPFYSSLASTFRVHSRPLKILCKEPSPIQFAPRRSRATTPRGKNSPSQAPKRGVSGAFALYSLYAGPKPTRTPPFFPPKVPSQLAPMPSPVLVWLTRQ